MRPFKYGCARAVWEGNWSSLTLTLLRDRTDRHCIGRVFVNGPHGGNWRRAFCDIWFRDDDLPPELVFVALSGAEPVIWENQVRQSGQFIILGGKSINGMQARIETESPWGGDRLTKEKLADALRYLYNVAHILGLR